MNGREGPSEELGDHPRTPFANWISVWYDPSIRSRLLFTIGALLAYRVARFVPLPGLDWTLIHGSFQAGLPDRLLQSEALVRLSVVSLSLTPYLTAWAFLEVFRSLIGERRAARWRLPLMLLLAAVQALGIAYALQEQNNLVLEPGPKFIATTTLSLIAGTACLYWLGKEISRRGLGDGLWLLIAAESLSTLPALAAGLWELTRTGAMSSHTIAAIPLAFACAIAFLVRLELAERRIPLERITPSTGDETPPPDLVLPLDRVTILPVFFASVLLPWLLFPTLTKPFWRQMFGQGEPAHLMLAALLVILLTFLITAIVASPAQEVEKLNRDGLTIAGVPVADSASQLDDIVTRITAITGVYLALNVVLPFLFIRWLEWPVAIGGMSLLIGVIVALGILRQIGAPLAQSDGG